MGDDFAVISFVATARNFCDLLETNTHRSKKRFLKQVLTATVSLYGAGLELPDVKPDAGFNPLGEWFEHNEGLPIAERINQNPEIKEPSRRKQLIRRNIILSLGGELPYQEIFEPFQGHEPVTGTVSDDLEDIYGDLKEGLLAMEGSERPSANIVWQWKFGLESHWGRHCNALQALLHVVQR